MSYVFIAFVVLMPAMLILFVRKTKGTTAFSILVLFSGSLYLCFLYYVNDALPFTGGGDDLEYFRASQVEFHRLADWFDLTQFKWTHEQAGYPLTLAWIHQMSGGNLFHRKALNVLWYLVLADVWFVIGRLCGGSRLAFAFGLSVLFGTPLWFYWMFLLKDMTITLLQSLFLLSFLLSLSQRNRLVGYGGVFLSTLMIIPFRSGLVFANLAVMIASLLFQRRRTRGSAISFFLRALAVGGFTAFLVILGNDPQVMSKLGVKSQSRAINTDVIEEVVDLGEKAGRGRENAFKFSLLFLVGEVTTFNPKSWANPGPTEFRAMGMIPWIYFGAPFFLVGTFRIIRYKPDPLAEGPRLQSGDSTCRTSDSQTLESDSGRARFLTLGLFIAVYVVIAWVTHDTTRWRLPAMPPMLAVASWGWITLSSRRRLQLSFSWGLAISVFALFYYTLFK